MMDNPPRAITLENIKQALGYMICEPVEVISMTLENHFHRFGLPNPYISCECRTFLTIADPWFINNSRGVALKLLEEVDRLEKENLELKNERLKGITMDKKLTITQAVVSIKVIRIDGKSLTLAVFKQIPEPQPDFFWANLKRIVFLGYVRQTYTEFKNSWQGIDRVVKDANWYLFVLEGKIFKLCEMDSRFPSVKSDGSLSAEIEFRLYEIHEPSLAALEQLYIAT